MTPHALSQIDSPVIEHAAKAVPLAVYAATIIGESLPTANFPLVERLGGAGKVRSLEPERMMRG